MGVDDPVGATVMDMVTDLLANNPGFVSLFIAITDAYDDPATADEDLDAGDITVYRLREGIERFMISDINNPAASARAQSEIFIQADWVSTDLGQEFNHVPGGCNVLYMDGHVEFVKYPGEWPVNKLMAVAQSQEVADAL